MAGPHFHPESDEKLELVDVNDPEKGLIATLKEIGFSNIVVDPRDAQEPHSVQDLPDEGVGI